MKTNMNFLKPIRLNLMAIFLTSVCFAAGGAPGGDSGGGGNLTLATNDKAITETDITMTLSYNVPFVLLNVFTQMEKDRIFLHLSAEARQMLFGDGPNNIFAVLNGESFHNNHNFFEVQAPGCYSTQAKELRDASTIGSGPKGHVCMSLDRLNERRKEKNFQIRLYALVAHEMSHLSGLDEDDAIKVQKVAEIILTADGLEFCKNSNQVVHRSMVKINSQLDAAMTNLPVDTPVARLKTCNQITNAVDEFSKVFGWAGESMSTKQFANRAGNFRGRSYDRVMEAEIRIRLLRLACRQDFVNPEDNEKIGTDILNLPQRFKGHASATYQDFLGYLDSSLVTPTYPLNQTPIHDVKSVADSDFEVELRQAQSLIQEWLKSWDSRYN